MEFTNLYCRMLARPNNKSRVLERAKLAFLPEKLFANLITHFPLEGKTHSIL